MFIEKKRKYMDMNLKVYLAIYLDSGRPYSFACPSVNVVAIETVALVDSLVVALVFGEVFVA